ncbi:Facilitated trehalose transporter Tret1 [Gryllus bimaculatus]|nr:Facilitated trehalose transporter Tret1 [Gryllus bimaculatus]
MHQWDMCGNININSTRIPLLTFLCNKTNLSVVAVGVSMGWTAPALPVLRGEQADASGAPRASLEEASWVSACMPLSAIFSALPAGALWLVYLGRLVMGLAVGPCTVFVPMYCEEIAERSIRGAVGSYLDMMMVLGNIWVYTLGTFVPYFWFTLLSVVVPLLFVATFFWMPESPLFLLSKGRADEARRALRWLRGSQFDIQPEFDALLASVEKPAPEAREKASLLGLLRTNPFRSTTVRAFSIVLGLMFFQQMSGINVFIFYAVQIFNEAGSNLSGHVSAIITGVVHFVASLIASITVDRVGRRFLLLASSSVATVCLTALAVYSYLHSSGHDTTSYSWLPLAALLVYLSMYSVGFGTLTWFMMAELMPERSKGWASAVAVCFNRVLTLLLTKECPILMERVGQDVVYGAFAGFCLVACVFVWVCVPETKGKTKEEILEKLGGDKP